MATLGGRMIRIKETEAIIDDPEEPNKDLYRQVHKTKIEQKHHHEKRPNTSHATKKWMPRNPKYVVGTGQM